MEQEKVLKSYSEVIKRQVEVAQETGDIPELFTYEHNGKSWVLTLPHSVMAQKRMIYARNKFWESNSYEDEKELLMLIAQNAKVENRPVDIEQLSIGEIEVLKQAYLDGLLLPLSLGGDHELMKYMTDLVSHTNK